MDTHFHFRRDAHSAGHHVRRHDCGVRHHPDRSAVCAIDGTRADGCARKYSVGRSAASNCAPAATPCPETAPQEVGRPNRSAHWLPSSPWTACGVSGWDRWKSPNSSAGNCSRKFLRWASAQFSQPTSPFGGISSITSISSPFGGQARRKGFWFNVNAELIIYGATEPDAQVTIGGRVIKLRPDGTLQLSFCPAGWRI